MATPCLPVGRETMSSALHEAHNFHAWTADWIRPWVRGRVLDVGGGTGNHLARLDVAELVSIDLSAECVAGLRRAHPGWRFECADMADPAVVERFGRESFDTVLSCNVFEHIEDDARCFRHARELLRPGGRLVLVLPAHALLFGPMDRLAGHHRRYDRRGVRRHLEAAGLRPLRLRYVNLLGAVGWLVNNRVLRPRDLSSPGINGQIGAFDRWLVPWLRRLEGERCMPFGQSLLCVGERPAG